MRRLSSVGLAPFFVALAALGCKSPGSDEKKNDPVISSPTIAPVSTGSGPTGPSVDTQTFPRLDAKEMKHPETNPTSPAKVALGHQLFFDPRLSVDGSVSCYSCHQNEHGNGGATPLAIGAKKKQLTRHSPTIWNVGFLPALYWDGRAASLEAQAKGAWGGGNMGVGAEGLDEKATEIAAIAGYAKQFAAVFPGRAVNADVVVEAISAYERTLICDDTRYDRYAGGDKSALSAEEKAGLALFTGKGLCAACHTPPHFSAGYFGAGAYFNVGVGTKDVPKEKVDAGRRAVTGVESDWAAFKPPTLRHVSKSAPYFHDGSAATLRDAVVFMASGGHDNEHKTALMNDKKLTPTEIDQLVAFLGALECPGRLETPELPR